MEADYCCFRSLWSFARVFWPLSILHKRWKKNVYCTKSTKFKVGCLDILSLSCSSKSFVLFELPQSEIQYVQYKIHDKQAIHPNVLESPIPCAELPQSQSHNADSVTGVQTYTCDSNKRVPPFCFSLTYLSCQLPIHRETENCAPQQFESHLYWSISPGFDCKIIWKAWGSGFWGWFPVGREGIQMAAFKS